MYMARCIYHLCEDLLNYCIKCERLIFLDTVKVLYSNCDKLSQFRVYMINIILL